MRGLFISLYPERLVRCIPCGGVTAVLRGTEHLFAARGAKPDEGRNQVRAHPVNDANVKRMLVRGDRCAWPATNAGLLSAQSRLHRRHEACYAYVQPPAPAMSPSVPCLFNRAVPSRCLVSKVLPKQRMSSRARRIFGEEEMTYAASLSIARDAGSGRSANRPEEHQVGGYA